MVSENGYLFHHIHNNHPNFLIIPFRQEDIFINQTISRKYKFDLKRKLEDRYPGKHIVITRNARTALEIALAQNKRKFDRIKIKIQTTSDNFYISSCVTKTIEKQNDWHRSRHKEYDRLLINHEFGFVDNRVLELSVDRDVLIEDCAFSFNSRYNNGVLSGTRSSYSILSFSKFFPIQIGGALVSDFPVEYEEDSRVSQYISSIVGYYFEHITKWSEYRLQLNNYYLEVFEEFGCSSYFPVSPKDIPGVFLFRPPSTIDLDALKEYFNGLGIQCSVFYGDHAFFLPLNQYIQRHHIEYFADLFKKFLKYNE